MKYLTLAVWLALSVAFAFSQTATTLINGTVFDESGKPLPFVNVFVKGSMDGASTNQDGTFLFTTSENGTITLVASFIGFHPYSITDNVRNMRPLKITLKAEAKNLDEVVVVAGNYQLKSASTLNHSSAVELVSTAGSEGDLYRSITMLPGAQVADRDGRLLVRGGSSRESQTYIDDMHVLSPYTPTFGEVGSRGRYSPFLFEGINFSMGGYVPEYSQGLSAVLPLYTRDEAKTSKFGVDLMNVSIGGSGTKAWRNASASFSLSYTDLSLYHELFFPSVKPFWKKPYRQIGGQNQIRFTLGENAHLKTYFAFDRTRFTMLQHTPFTPKMRDVVFGEDNFYFNTTFRKRFDCGWQFFSGMAFSGNMQRIDNARVANDSLDVCEHEIHLKSKAEKRLTDFYKLSFGTEAFFKQFAFAYCDTKPFESNFDHTIFGAFLSNDFNLSNHLFLNVSSRVEYTSLSRKWALLPRAALSYVWRDFTLSGVIGKYQQNAENDILLYNQKLLPENNLQTLIGAYYQNNNKVVRLEAYYKKYNQLPLKGGDVHFYSSDGKGFAKGIDVFFNDTRFLKNWEYMFAYSYTDAQRKYLDFPESVRPSFAMRHNASVAIRYTNWNIRSIFSLSNRFATGRPYNNPNHSGFMDAETPVYNSLDASWIILPHKRVITYLGFANILNRTNVFGYAFDSSPNAVGRYDRVPLTQQVNQGIYIGCFISLGKNAAYNASNF